jgi:hypothetical protein
MCGWLDAKLIHLRGKLVGVLRGRVGNGWWLDAKLIHLRGKLVGVKRGRVSKSRETTSSIPHYCRVWLLVRFLCSLCL